MPVARSRKRKHQDAGKEQDKRPKPPASQLSKDQKRELKFIRKLGEKIIEQCTAERFESKLSQDEEFLFERLETAIASLPNSELKGGLRRNLSQHQETLKQLIDEARDAFLSSASAQEKSKKGRDKAPFSPDFNLCTKASFGAVTQVLEERGDYLESLARTSFCPAEVRLLYINNAKGFKGEGEMRSLLKQVEAVRESLFSLPLSSTSSLYGLGQFRSVVSSLSSLTHQMVDYFVSHPEGETKDLARELRETLSVGRSLLFLCWRHPFFSQSLYRSSDVRVRAMLQHDSLFDPVREKERTAAKERETVEAVMEGLSQLLAECTVVHILLLSLRRAERDQARSDSSSSSSSDEDDEDETPEKEDRSRSAASFSLSQPVSYWISLASLFHHSSPSSSFFLQALLDIVSSVCSLLQANQLVVSRDHCEEMLRGIVGQGLTRLKVGNGEDTKTYSRYVKLIRGLLTLCELFDVPSLSFSIKAKATIPLPNAFHQWLATSLAGSESSVYGVERRALERIVRKGQAPGPTESLCNRDLFSDEALDTLFDGYFLASTSSQSTNGTGSRGEGAPLAEQALFFMDTRGGARGERGKKSEKEQEEDSAEMHRVNEEINALLRGNSRREEEMSEDEETSDSSDED